jgi:hypothetical protein
VTSCGSRPASSSSRNAHTNGVAERLNRTLNEQAIYGHVFRNIEPARRAVGEFVERCDAHWRLKKLGFRTPQDDRQTHALEEAA